MVLRCVLVAAGVRWLVSRSVTSTREPPPAAAASAPAAWRSFTARAVGVPPQGDERPLITHVAVADLDRDGLGDIIVCDALRNRGRLDPAGPARHVHRADDRQASPRPAHVEAVDFDRDGDLDLLVGALGFLFPNNTRVGSVLVLENDGRQRFTTRTLVDHVARVADARAADLDGDGDLDVGVAGFGYDDGETSWLENTGRLAIRAARAAAAVGRHQRGALRRRRRQRPDIVALISQEWEEIWAFVNAGRGGFTPRMMWGSTNPDFGSSWLSMVDLDRDGDPDILYANGDAFEYAPPNSRPWQGVQWLENRASCASSCTGMVSLQGATSPEAADLDGDGDLDVLLVTSNNDWDDPRPPSLLWLENDGVMRFTLRGIATAPTHLQTVAAGDLDGDGKPDAVTGGMHISRPYDRLGRVTAWFRK